MSRSHRTDSQTNKRDSSVLSDAQRLVDELRHNEAYPSCPIDCPIVVHETHVSWVFLAGDHAYKIKKPITTGFLDYGTLAKRERFCHQECRLNRRYAHDLYIGVVPITREQGAIRVEGRGDPVEFAVKMRRFPDDALLSQRLVSGKIANEEVFQLAATVADFHQKASRSEPDQPWGSPEIILKEAIDNFQDLRVALSADPLDESSRKRLNQLQAWTEHSYERLRSVIADRRQHGFIRECHGDLHLSNVIRWQGRWTPFDGIEFNEEFRWIDILSDAAFLAMDFAAQGHLDLARSFISAYLEGTGDYQGLPLLRWYLVYRAMVRAKVAAIRSQQDGQTERAQQQERRESLDHVDLAGRLAESTATRLWITFGVSGSGKTTGSEYVVQHHGAIRLRSDVERKRQFGMKPTQRPKGTLQRQIYSSAVTEQIYHRLRDLARALLRSGESVVVDATFLRRGQRDLFRNLADDEGSEFAILLFNADRSELERRLNARSHQDTDASDADLHVLQTQLDSIEPLSEDEARYSIEPFHGNDG